MTLGQRMRDAGFTTWDFQGRWSPIPVGGDLYASKEAIIAYLKWLGLMMYLDGTWGY